MSNADRWPGYAIHRRRAALAGLDCKPRRQCHTRRASMRIAIRRHCNGQGRSEEHTSEFQSLMRSSYAVWCLKKKTITTTVTNISETAQCYSARLKYEGHR